ncbi:MAG TPA: hypothetical protein VLM80_03780 [Anaerolineales bacterium]|nr:hypothetical protein [Anaerolineales bacterium]
MPIIIEKPTISCDGQRLDIIIHSKGSAFHLFFYSEDVALWSSPEALVAATLLPAMKTKAGSIQLQNQPSPLFMQNLEKIQAIYKSWKPGYQHVQIKATQPSLFTGTSGERVGLFYSAGVDSSYSLLKHQDQITDLIFIQGFDIPYDSQNLIEKRAEKIYRVADHLGIGVVEIQTNLRKFLDTNVFWGLSHGAALACMGHLLSSEFSRIFIAPGYSQRALRPWGSHPHLDPLWSNESLEFIHNEEDLVRPQRVAQIANNQAILDNLHVCLHNLPSGLNCGKCEKCVRTMISLRALGVLNRCKTFEHPLTNWSIYSTYLFRSDIRYFVDFNLELAEQVGSDQDLIKILRQISKSPRLPGIRKTISRLGWKQPGKIARKF